MYLVAHTKTFTKGRPVFSRSTENGPACPYLLHRLGNQNTGEVPEPTRHLRGDCRGRGRRRRRCRPLDRYSKLSRLAAPRLRAEGGPRLLGVGVLQHDPGAPPPKVAQSPALPVSSVPLVFNEWRCANMTRPASSTAASAIGPRPRSCVDAAWPLLPRAMRAANRWRWFGVGWRWLGFGWRWVADRWRLNHQRVRFHKWPRSPTSDHDTSAPCNAGPEFAAGHVSVLQVLQRAPTERWHVGGCQTGVGSSLLLSRQPQLLHRHSQNTPLFSEIRFSDSAFLLAAGHVTMLQAENPHTEL